MNTKKNFTLDFLKLLASYMVIFIHVPFLGRLGSIVDAVARFAVPLFFLVSGFYSYNIKVEKIKIRTSYIVKLFLQSTICYTLFNICLLIFKGTENGVIKYFSKYLDFTTFIRFLLFNEAVSSVHLWYLLAIAYVYVLFFFVIKYRLNEKIVFSVSFLLLCLNIILGECLTLFDVIVPAYFMRNFALTGIPFFTLGMLARKYENKLHNIPNIVIIIAGVIGVIESVFSRHYLGKNELYIGSLFILFGIVVAFVKFSNIKYPGFIENLSGCSTYIYIFHVMVSHIITELYFVFNIDYTSSDLLTFIHPLIVCIVSTTLAFFLIQMTNIARKKKR